MQRIPIRKRQGGRPRKGAADDGPIVAYALVDDEDYEKVAAHRWRMSLGRPMAGKALQMHRLVLDAPADRRLVIVHLNDDFLDNQRANLALVTKQEAIFRQTGQIGRPRSTEHEVDPVTGCWEWLLARNKEGYGLVVRDGRT